MRYRRILIFDAKRESIASERLSNVQSSYPGKSSFCSTLRQLAIVVYIDAIYSYNRLYLQPF